MHRPCEAVELFIAEGPDLNPAVASAGPSGTGFDTIRTFLPFLHVGGRRQNNQATLEAISLRNCPFAESQRISLIFTRYLAHVSREVCGNWRLFTGQRKEGAGNGNVEPVLRIPPLTAFSVDSPRCSECPSPAKTEV